MKYFGISEAGSEGILLFILFLYSFLNYDLRSPPSANLLIVGCVSKFSCILTNSNRDREVIINQWQPDIDMTYVIGLI